MWMAEDSFEFRLRGKTKWGGSMGCLFGRVLSFAVMRLYDVVHLTGGILEVVVD